MVSVSIVFETHSISEDNENGIKTGWLPGRLSARGRELAKALGDRRRDEGIAGVFSSDLRRAVETAEIAFTGSEFPLFLDWRLRECNYGEHNGASTANMQAERRRHLYDPYPGGESWQEALERVSWFLHDLPKRWSGGRVLIIGHVATRWALDHFINGDSLETLVERDFSWQEGWEHQSS